MTFGIYKPGQGYWVRVLTATMIGVLFLAAAAWLMGQATLVAERLRGANGERTIQPVVLQALVAGIVLIIGAGVAYYAAAMSKRFVDFLIATDGEMKKVNWSTGKDIRMSTLVVIFASVVLSGVLFAVDFGFQWFFSAIGVLVR